MTEFDYRGEARNLKEIADNIMPLFGKEVYIPQPHMDLCTTTVMVMDFVPGKRLIDGIMDQHRRWVRARVGVAWDLSIPNLPRRLWCVSRQVRCDDGHDAGEAAGGAQGKA